VGLSPADYFAQREQRRRRCRDGLAATVFASRRLLGCSGRLRIAEIGLAITVIQGVHRRWHIEQKEDRQPRVGDHQVKRQQQHGAGVMRVEPGSLAFGGAEGEELLEDLLVDDDAADQRHQHRHGREPHHPYAQRARQVQGVMEMEEEVAADGFPRLDSRPAQRVEVGHTASTPAPFTDRDGQVRRTRGRQADIPVRFVGVTLC